MKRMRILGLGLAWVAAVSAFATPVASAKSRLALEDIGELGPVLVPTLTPVAFQYATKGGAVFSTSAGEVNCGFVTSGLKYPLLSNVAAKDVLEVGTLEMALCESTIPLLGSGPPAITVGSGPMQLTFGANGKAELRTQSSVPMVFQIGFSGGATCFFEAKKLKGTNPAGAEPAKLGVEFQNQKLKLNAASSAGCPKKATITLRASEFWAELEGLTYYVYAVVV